jgi:hypothetical protein
MTNENIDFVILPIFSRMVECPCYRLSYGCHAGNHLQDMIQDSGLSGTL